MSKKSNSNESDNSNLNGNLSFTALSQSKQIADEFNAIANIDTAIKDCKESLLNDLTKFEIMSYYNPGKANKSNLTSLKDLAHCLLYLEPDDIEDYETFHSLYEIYLSLCKKYMVNKKRDKVCV